MVPVRLILGKVGHCQAQHFRSQLNLDFDLGHFRSESATYAPNKNVATTVGVWPSPCMFQKVKNKFRSPTKVQQ